MTLIIWLLPPLASFALTYYFNHKKVQRYDRFFWINTGLDAVFSTFVLYAILLRLVVDAGFFTIFSIAIFLIAGLYRFMQGDVRGHNIDVESETIKNTLVIIGTLLLTYIVAWFYLDMINSVVRIVASIGIAVALFGVSLGLKHLVKRFFEYLQLRIQFMHDLTVIVVIYVVAATALIAVTALTVVSLYVRPVYDVRYDFNFNPALIDDSNLIDYEEATIIDFDMSRVDRTVFLFRQDNTDYLSVFTFSDGESATEVNALPHNGTSTLEPFPYRSRFNQGYIDFVTPSEGLYVYTNDDLSIVPTSENLHVDFVSMSMCANCFIVDNRDDTYFILNNVFQIIETIDLSDSTDELAIIDRQVFYIRNNTYVHHDDETVVFDIVNGTPTYDIDGQTMYTLLHENNTVTLTRQVLNGEVITDTFSMEDGYQALPLFEGNAFYKPVHMFQTKHKTVFGDGLDLLSHLQSDGTYLSILRYNPDSFLVGPNESRSRAAVLNITNNRSILVYRQASLDLDVTIDDTPVLNLVRLFIVTVAMLLFIPITNYQNTTTIIDFDTQIKKTNE